MSSDDEDDEPLNIETFKDIDPEYIAQTIEISVGLGKLDNLSALLNRYDSAWSQNPMIAARLIAEAEKSAPFQIILANHKEINVDNLKNSLAQANHQEAYLALQSHRASRVLRELRNSVVFEAYAKVQPDNQLYRTVNPTAHKNDSMPKLVRYLINNSEAAPHFLEKQRVRRALARKPALIQELMLKGDENLRIEVAKLMSQIKIKGTLPSRWRIKKQAKTELRAKIKEETAKETTRETKTAATHTSQKKWPSAPPPKPPIEDILNATTKLPTPEELQTLFNNAKESARKNYEPITGLNETEAFSKKFGKALEQRVDRQFSEAATKYAVKNDSISGFYESRAFQTYEKQPADTENSQKQTPAEALPKTPTLTRGGHR